MSEKIRFGFLVGFPSRMVVYYEEKKKKLNRKLIYECRCNERLTSEIKMRDLQVLTTLGCVGELEHLKIDDKDVTHFGLDL